MWKTGENSAFSTKRPLEQALLQGAFDVYREKAALKWVFHPLHNFNMMFVPINSVLIFLLL